MHINGILPCIKTNTFSTSHSAKPELTLGEGKSRINHAASLKDSGGIPRYNHSLKQQDTPSAGRFFEAIAEEISNGIEDMAYSAKKFFQPKPQYSAEYQAIKAKYQKGSTDQASIQQGEARPGTASNKTEEVFFDLDKTSKNVDKFFQSSPNQTAKFSNQPAGKERPLTVDDILPIDDDIPEPSTHAAKKERPLTVDDILPIDDDIPGASTHAAKKERPLIIEGDIVKIDINDTPDDQMIQTKHFHKLSLTNELAQEVLDKLKTLVDNGNIELGVVDQEEITQLRESLNGLNELKPYVLEGKHNDLPDRYADVPKEVMGLNMRSMRVAADYLSLHQTCTTALANLAARFPNELLPMMDNVEQLGVLSSEAIKALDKESAGMVKNTMKLLGDSDPAVKSALNYSTTTTGSIADSSNDALAEAQLQKDVLNILNSAITEYSQQKLDSHRNSFFKALDCLVGVDAEAYGNKLETELEKHFGPFFDINVTRDESISVSLKKGALGSLSSNEFLQILNSARDSLENKYDQETLKDAINFSPDIELTGTNGKEQIAFTDKAKTRLTQAHARADVAPLDKLRNNIVQTAEQITVATVKSNLLSHVEKDVKNQIDKLGKSLLPSSLSIDNFELIENLISDLAKSHSTKDMLDRVNQAIDDHDKRLNKNLIKRFNHDTDVTGKTLDNMVSVLKAFDSGSR